MIEIKIHPFRIEAKGHAGYDEPGRDIVCAAVSTLLSALSLGVERESNYGCLAAFESALEQGAAVITAKPHPPYLREVRLLFDVFAQALLQIAEQYPEYVRIAT